MKKSKVILVKCDSYDAKELDTAFEKLYSIALANDIKLPKDQEIILKPNLLAPDAPEKATTTHPQIFRRSALLLQKLGNKLYFGDSPGIGNLSKNSEVSGILAVAKDLKIPVLDFEEECVVDYSEGLMSKRFILAKSVTAGKKIVNLPKLKTHAQMLLTGAVKNVFGCVPGIHKPELHVTMQTPENFAKMIVDLHAYIAPAFNIVDAVIGQDGNGPRAGTVKKIGYIIAGEDAFAIDIVAAKLLGININDIPILKWSIECEKVDPQNIEVLGDVAPDGIVSGFSLPPSIIPMNGLPDFIVKRIKAYLVSRPEVDTKKCVMCMKCVEKCHAKPKAISARGNRIRFDYSKCIRCYCCQEVCPEGAIAAKENFINNILKKVYRVITG